VRISSIAVAAAALHEALQKLLERSDLTDAAITRCPAVSAAYIAAVAAAEASLFEVAAPVSGIAMHEGLHTYRGELLAIIARETRPHLLMPMHALWLKAATRFVLAWHVLDALIPPHGGVGRRLQGVEIACTGQAVDVIVSGSSASTAATTGVTEQSPTVTLEMVRQLLGSPVMEVRAEALRCLFKHSSALGGTSTTSWMPAPATVQEDLASDSQLFGTSGLQLKLWEMACHDVSAKVQRRALRLHAVLLARCSLCRGFKTLFPGLTAQQMASELLVVLHTSTQRAVQQHALVCLGSLMAVMHSDSEHSVSDDYLQRCAGLTNSCSIT
jgi:hypothetical protein